LAVSIRIQPLGPLALPDTCAFSTMYEHIGILLELVVVQCSLRKVLVLARAAQPASVLP
jgi:hypothetical protein